MMHYGLLEPLTRLLLDVLAEQVKSSGKASHILSLEHKAYWALKHANFDLKTAGDHRKLQLNELSELRDQAYENSLIYKEKTKKLHDSKIKNRIFNVGDQVLLFNSRLKIFSGKLKSRWSGPFTITEVYPYGTAKLSHTDGSNFKVNCHRLKHYYGGDTPPLVIPDLQTFPRFHQLFLKTLVFSVVFAPYGYIKNHMKTVKNKQARTRERKSEQKPEAKPGKSSLSQSMEEAQGVWVFCAKTFTKEAQMHPKENDMLAILRVIILPSYHNKEWLVLGKRLRVGDWFTNSQGEVMIPPKELASPDVEYANGKAYQTTHVAEVVPKLLLVQVSCASSTYVQKFHVFIVKTQARLDVDVKFSNFNFSRIKTEDLYKNLELT
ncbi:hypothetical protein Tco_0892909 [Tanacetum coccineum]|uniref:Reverse transcriptase domain-containing protein n=1 Tax=Tanacetum coccineum TaxID=301880 RepID=A0ABQ5C8Z1_9ASTR